MLVGVEEYSKITPHKVSNHKNNNKHNNNNNNNNNDSPQRKIVTILRYPRVSESSKM